MSGASGNPDQGTCPALSPPPILPWNKFDTDREDDYADAVFLIAEILMDDEWHSKTDVVEEVMYELEFTRKAVLKLIGLIKSHGDIRQDGDEIRLTTRWKGWQDPDDVQEVRAS